VLALTAASLAALLAVGSAACFGVSDFVAGLASRRSSAAAVGVVVQTTAALFAAAFALAVGATASHDAVLWGAIAGLGSGCGTFGLYRGLARGRMAVVAPVAAVTSAAFPVLIALALGEQPGALAWAGIALALPATALVSAVGDTASDRPSGLPDALLAGLGFTVLYVGLHAAGRDSGTWPVAVQMACSLAVLLPLAVAGRVRDAVRARRGERAGVATGAGRMGKRTVGASVLAGVLGGAAGGLFVAAAASGGLAVASVLTSLFPAFTVLLACTVLHERIRGVQAVGLVAAAVSIALVAA
jgi:drug/metabolite transporter (DMT)-like permease